MRAASYMSHQPVCARPNWDHESLDLVEHYLPPSEHLALAHYRDLHAQRQSLPQDSASFGLIHQDAHGGNFLVDDQGQITLFDFDDCLYSWFINDIAMAIFYRLLGETDMVGLAHEFLPPFMAGYFAPPTSWTQAGWQPSHSFSRCARLNCLL